MSNLNKVAFLEMRLGGSNHVLPPLAKMLAVNHSINSVVAEVRVKRLNLRL